MTGQKNIFHKKVLIDISLITKHVIYSRLNTKNLTLKQKDLPDCTQSVL
jgi:hypothetical protein